MSCADDYGGIWIEVVLQHIACEAEGMTASVIRPGLECDTSA